MSETFRFFFDPWNIPEGADLLEPEIRKTIALNRKLECYKKMGLDYIEFHGEDAALNKNNQIIGEASEFKKVLANHGLIAESVVPFRALDPVQEPKLLYSQRNAEARQ